MFGIGNGYNNCIDSATYGFIGNGCQNKVCAGTLHGFIGSGFRNNVSSPFSAILGGSGNTVAAGYTHVDMFGNNLNTCSSYTFHVNCLNAVNKPGPGVCH